MMNDDYALDRRANQLYDAAMTQRRAAIQANEKRKYALSLNEQTALRAQEDGHWRRYDALLNQLNDVYAAIRRQNAETYPKADRSPRIERIMSKCQPLRPSEARRNEKVLHILQRDGEVKASLLINELRCSRSAVYSSLYYLEAWGFVDRSIRGVWRIIEDESA